MTLDAVIHLDERDLDASRGAIKKRVESEGFAVLQAWDTEPDTLRRVASLFGPIQSHIRANEQGVVGVGGPQRTDAEWHKYRAEYHGLGTNEVAPHTDGTFVDGAIVRGSAVLRVGPPRYVILHVVHHADEGGASVIVDAQRVFDSLLQGDPDMLAALLSPGSISFCRDDQLALDKQVFRMVSEGHVKVRYRGDSKAYSPSWALRPVQLLQTNYHLSPEFRTRVDLEEGQLLVADNTRVLHGREPFTVEDTGAGDGRKLHRVWILDDDEHEPGMLANLDDEVPRSRALAVYEPYGPVDNDVAVDEPISIDTGIRLGEESARQVADLLAEPVVR